MHTHRSAGLIYGTSAGTQVLQRAIGMCRDGRTQQAPAAASRGHMAGHGAAPAAGGRRL